MKERKKETVVLDEQSWRGWNSTAASGIFDVSRCFELEDPLVGCVSRVFFFFSPPFRIKRIFVIVCPRCAMGERVTRRRKRKIGTGNMEGDMSHDEFSRERLPLNSITSVKYILSNIGEWMVKSFNHMKRWETGEVYEIRVEILWKWEIQLFPMACN